MKKTLGKIIIPSNSFIENHELNTAKYFVKQGKDVEFLMRKFASKTPDIKMDGILWEIKSPIGSGSRTIENIYRKAAKQSSNVIFDLQRISQANEAIFIKQIKREFNLRRHTIVKILIITKNKQLIELK